MHIASGNNHRGSEFKQVIVSLSVELGNSCQDFG